MFYECKTLFFRNEYLRLYTIVGQRKLNIWKHFWSGKHRPGLAQSNIASQLGKPSLNKSSITFFTLGSDPPLFSGKCNKKPKKN